MADVVGAMTERLLVDAGIGGGMRVLDVGCGHGFVAHLAARLVGETGQVVGVDSNPQPLEAAREKARELGLANVSFVEGDLQALPEGLGLFDAIVGRRVLMYQGNAEEVVRRLARALRPGGLMVFQEHDSTSVGGQTPLHTKVRAWIWNTVTREGANVHLGFNLWPVLTGAGLVVEQIRAEALVQTPDTRYETAAIIRAMMPRIVRHGVATEEEIDVETLDRRLTEELQRAKATYIGELVFGAWAHKPEAETQP